MVCAAGHSSMARTLSCSAKPSPRTRSMFPRACKLGLEGIVSERAGDIGGGNGRAWLKSRDPAFLRE
jgi:hypothetical protein